MATAQQAEYLERAKKIARDKLGPVALPASGGVYEAADFVKSYIMSQTGLETLTMKDINTITAEQWEKILSTLEALEPQQCAEMVIFGSVDK